MTSADFDQEDRIDALMENIIKKNGFPDEEIVVRELEEIIKDMPLPRKLDVISEIHALYT